LWLSDSAHAFRTFYGMRWPERFVPPLLRAGERHADAVARVLKPLLRTWLPDPLARLGGAVNWYLCPPRWRIGAGGGVAK